MFSEAIRIVMDGLKNSESLDYITSNNYQKDINDIRYLLDLDKNEEIGLNAFKMIVQDNLISDNVILDEQKRIDTKERLRKSYKKIKYFCDRMEYLGIICEDKDAQSTIINYYKSTIIKTYEKLKPLIEKTRQEQNNKELFIHYESLYNLSLQQSNTTTNNKMKTKKKILMVALMMLFSATAMQAQTYEWQKTPKEGEKEVEMIIDTVYGSFKRTSYIHGVTSCDDRRNYSVEQLYKFVLDKLKVKIGEKYPDFALRQFKWRVEDENVDYYYYDNNKLKYSITHRYYYISAILVIPGVTKPIENPLEKAVDKALLEVREGARIAIDQIRVPSGTDKEEYKDEVVEILLDKGFKVVAKEYMERLYEEQQSQQSGIYNDRTTVKENNLSAVGYYLNVKLTDTALRVQIINVSTGEYEGNVTIKLQE